MLNYYHPVPYYRHLLHPGISFSPDRGINTLTKPFPQFTTVQPELILAFCLLFAGDIWRCTPDLSSNCYSRACLEQTHFNYPPIGQVLIFPLTPSDDVQWERCAPAAFLRSMSNLSGPLSRIEPLSSVPVVTKACPLGCRLVDRSEARCKSHSPEIPRDPVAFLSGLNVRSFRFLWPDGRTSPTSRTEAQSAGSVSSISLRITRVILVARTLAPKGVETGLACFGLQLVCGAVRRFRENCFLLFEDMHGLVFRKSIHYWQDQPGIQEEAQTSASTRGGLWIACSC
jgi:hypothetical protein